MPKTTLTQLLKLNKDVNFSTLNFFNKEAVAQLNFEKKSETSLEEQTELLRTHQRLLRITDDAHSAKKLQSKNLHSAIEIATLPEHKFVQTYASAFKANGISSEAQAKKAHKKALAIKSNVILKHQAYLQHNQPHYNAMRVSNLKSATDNALKHLPSYQKLFGAIDFCSCPECRSIFSPAAYFVDLMRLEDNYITDNAEAGARIPLKTRRPDLWELPLSCENTNTEIPKLRIVNEILEKHLEEKETIFKGFESFLDAPYPLNLPFNLPLSETRSSLAQQKTSLPQLWDQLKFGEGNRPDSYYLEQANLTFEQWEIVISSIDPKEEDIKRLYGLDATEKLNDVQVFLQQTGLAMNQLDELIGEGLVEREREKLFINQDAPELPIQYNSVVSKEKLENLLQILAPTYPRLSRVNRFVRLAGYLNWSFPDLDWVIRCNNYQLDDTLLPYLAWFQQQLKANKNTSINQLCGILFKLKTTGTANGSSFFDSIFNAPNVPPLPEGKEWDKNTSWSVPSMEEMETSSDEENQNDAIQTSLKAALKLSSNDLIRIGNAFIEGQELENREISLSLENLSILYRLSQLPAFTNFDIHEYLTVLNWHGESADALKNMVGSDANLVLSQLLNLQAISNYLEKNPFNVYVVQYFLSGKSSSPEVQNQILGGETIANFISTLRETVQPALLTSEVFDASFNSLLRFDDLIANATVAFYKNLTTKTVIVEETEENYIVDGKLKNIPAISTISKWFIDDVIFPEAVKSDNWNVTEVSKNLNAALEGYKTETFAEEILSTLFSTLNLSYHALASMSTDEKGVVISIMDEASTEKLFKSLAFELDESNASYEEVKSLIIKGSKQLLDAQQFIYHQQLGALVSTDATTSSELAAWVELTLEDLLDESKTKSVTTKLKEVQRYAAVIRATALSTEEVQFIYKNPSWFNINIRDKKPDLTWQNIETLYEFKRMIQRFDDTQNGFLTLMNNVNNPDAKVSKEEDIALLHQLTQWSEEQIAWLFNKAATTTDRFKTLTVYGTADGLQVMQRWFVTTIGLNTSVQQLNQVINVINSNANYENCQLAVNTLFGAFNSIYSENPEVIGSLVAKTDQQKRNVLVPYTLWVLNKSGVELKTARDLYEYFLIDVEVSGEVLTSRVLEAISAVQLYIYRSRNNLEPGVQVHDDLNTWWEWIGTYRVWQANREVFLYPENYIQPELRTNTTPQFEALTDDLQQGNLSDESNITTAFNNYMEAFDEIANLEIQGSAARSYRDEEGNSKKELCFVGKSQNDPATWYYRLVTFMKIDSKTQKFEPVHWDPWLEITVNMNPVGAVNPVFAFGTWYVFWVETYKGEGTSETSTVVIDGEETKVEEVKSKNVAKIMYSYLDYNNKWVAQQTLKDCLLSSAFEVYPVFYASAQCINVLYEVKGEIQNYQLAKNKELADFSTSISFVTRHALPQKPDWLNGKFEILDSDEVPKYTTEFTYAGAIGNYVVKGECQSVSFWFNYEKTGNIKPLLSAVGINSDSGVLENEENIIYPKTKVNDNAWNNIILNSSYEKLDIGDTPSFAYHDGKLYAVWISANLAFGATINPSNYQIIEKKQLIFNEVDKFDAIGIGKSKNEMFVSVFNDTQLIFFITRLDKLLEGESQQVKEISFEGSVGHPIKKLQLVDMGSLILFYSKAADVESKSILYAAQITDTSGEYIDDIKLKQVQNNSESLALDRAVETAWAVENNGKNIFWFGGNFGSLQFSSEDKSFTISKQQKVEELNLVKAPFFYELENISKKIVIGLIDGKIVISYLDIIAEGVKFDFSTETEWVSECGQFTISEIDNALHTIYRKNSTDKNLYTVVMNSIVLNGQSIPGVSQPISFDSEINIGSRKVGSITNLLDGSFSEILFFNEPTTLDQAELLYNQAKDHMPQNFDLYLPYNTDEKFGAIGYPKGYENTEVKKQSILGQPNWLNTSLNSQFYLNTPYVEIKHLDGKDELRIGIHSLNSQAAKDLKYTMNNAGVKGLLKVENQQLPEANFELLEPNRQFIQEENDPPKYMDFNSGAMSTYFWDIFFHSPFLIANSLQIQQQFEESKDWYDIIFNPTINQENDDLEKDEDENDKYWRFVGLRSYNNLLLADELERTAAQEILYDLEDSTGKEQIYEYHNDPFNPHAIANLRPIAYQKTMVMHYVQNLIDWGDQLFRQYTQETILEAVMLYVLAYDLLGKQPDNMGACPLPPTEDLDAMIAKATKGKNPKSPKDINEFLVDLEQNTSKVATLNVGDTPANYIPGIYFGIPDNERFRTYWETIEQRLFNIRHQLNIDGISQSLALFEPAIDPMQLVKAVGNGQSLSQALGTLASTVPYYRFEIMVQKAKDLAQQVASLGQSLLSILEKKDAEELALLMNTNERNLMAMSIESREYAIDEASNNLEGLQTSLQSAKMRSKHYENLISKGRLSAEEVSLNTQISSVAFQSAAAPIIALSTPGFMAPNVFGLANGGMQFGHGIAAGGVALQNLSGIMQTSSSIASMNAEFQRRNEDWSLQQRMAEFDVEQLTAQITASMLQQKIVDRELKILEKNIDNLERVQEHNKNKFTNSELYQWMSGKVAALYFQTYQLAADTAQQAEQAWQFEKGVDQSFIQTGYWDSLRQGLMAGDSLLLDINRMESAYMKQNVRRLEITKTISLNALAPNELDRLRSQEDEGKKANFTFSEEMFDVDYPGHYSRQIKSISISFPMLLGPYQNVRATLTQTSNYVLLEPDLKGVEALNTFEEIPASIRSNALSNQQIALSQGINDNGMFVINFEDARYLPFEGTGAVSTWELDMSSMHEEAMKSLTDVIIELKYTALAGSESFKNSVRED